MNKNYFILIVVFISTKLIAGVACDDDSTLSGVVNTGFDNGTSINSEEWLSHRLNSGMLHPDVPLGDRCDFGIRVVGRDGIYHDSAYYLKEHNENSDIRFRFILSTENLLESFSIDQDIVLYKFVALALNSTGGYDKRLIKIRLKKIAEDTSNNIEWQLKFQWFDNNLSENIRQKINFHTDDDFIEIEYFWKKIISYGLEEDVQYSKLQAGVLVTIGAGSKPHVFLSPYAYENLYIDLKGKSYLGYINSNHNPAHEGDEIRILSPLKYNSN